MIPLRLELRGFTCFRETTVVDFSDLEDDLFAIAGPTGSGKSTLLDAITYALYGQTARLGSSGLRDALVSPGLDDMAVQLAFRAGDATYRITRTVVHRPNSVSSDVRLERLEGDADWRTLPASEKIREANAEVERLVGLDYNGFSRAVLLPQGAFDRFLRGDAAERRRLLARLLGLDTVEAVGRRAGQEARAAQQTVASIDTRLAEDYEGATPARRRELADALSEANDAAGELDARLGELEAREKAFERRAALDTARRQARAELDRLGARREAIERDRERLERARDARLLAPQLEQLERRRARRAELVERRDRAAEAAKTTEETVATRREARDEARRAREAAEPEIASALEALAAAKPAADRLARLAASLPGRSGDPQALAERSDGAPFDEAAFEALRAARADLPGIERRLAERDRSLRAAAEARAAAERERSAAQTARDEMARLVERGKAAAAEVDRARDALRRAETEHRAAALRAGLESGDRCPVCGAEVGDLPAGEHGDLERLAADLETRREARDELRERFKDRKAAAGTHAERAETREGEAARADEARAAVEGDLDDALGSLPAPLAPDLDDPERFGALEPAALRRELDTRAADQLARLAAEVHATTGGRDPEARRAELTQRRERLRRAEREAEAAFAEAQRAADAARRDRERFDEQLREAASDLERAETGFAEAIEASGFADAAAVAAARLDPAEIERLEGAIATFEENRRAAERRLAEAERDLAGESYDETAHGELRREIAEARRRAAELATERGRFAAELERVEEQLGRAKALREQRRAAEARFDLYRTLQQDLRGNNFPAFLMTRVQQQLAAHASAIVRDVTEGRYDLRLIDDEFHVRDAWAGGEARSAKTLSGGETFIASLALALALSDTLAGSRTLGALFLDEGFGTLDRQTLDAVATVLEHLASRGRMVGIITHVTELTERIPARLRVEKGPQGSTAVWEA